MAVNGADLGEHATTLVAVIGALLVIAQSLVAVIFLGMKGDLREIKTSMQVFTKEIFERLRKAELSLEKIWTEHRLSQSKCGTEHHHHREHDADEAP